MHLDSAKPQRRADRPTPAGVAEGAVKVADASQRGLWRRRGQAADWSRV